MGRHKLVNPKTGRKVLKTGALGRNIQKAMKKKNTNNKTTIVCKDGKCVKAKRSSAEPKKTEVKVAGKTKGCVPRPSARANYDANNFQPQFYANKWHYLHVDCNGKPTYKVIKHSSASSANYDADNFQPNTQTKQTK